MRQHDAPADHTEMIHPNQNYGIISGTQSQSELLFPLAQVLFLYDLRR